MSNQIEIWFPDLKASGYKITSDASTDYNCIAWAAGDNTRRWDPDPDGYWPRNVPRNNSLQALIQLYGTLGYQPCDLDDTLEPGFEKVALYIGPNGRATHAAKQLASGTWTSKLGDFEDIQHDSLEGLCNSSYGIVARVLKRPRKSQERKKTKRR